MTKVRKSGGLIERVWKRQEVITQNARWHCLGHKVMQSVKTQRCQHLLLAVGGGANVAAMKGVFGQEAIESIDRLDCLHDLFLVGQ
jgi:hypothetical protein